MRVFALCTHRSKAAVHKALRVEPATAPPIVAPSGVLETQAAKDADFWYFRLHGRQDVPGVWYGEGQKGLWSPALHVDEIDELDLSGKLVVTSTCWAMDSHFPIAFKAAGADFIGGYGFNYAAAGGRVIGADKLASSIYRGLRLGFSPARAFRLAKAWLLPTAWRRADRDALAFTLV